MAIAYLGLGTNLGCREENLLRASHLINERVGRVTSLSSFYETEPWGFTSSHAFLNAALGVETSLTPWQLLDLTKAIEREMGRTAKSTGGVYADRLIDIDILLYEDRVLQDPLLTIPHPLMLNRSFVMLPLIEIAPFAFHPIAGKPLFLLN